MTTIPPRLRQLHDSAEDWDNLVDSYAASSTTRVSRWTGISKGGQVPIPPQYASSSARASPPSNSRKSMNPGGVMVLPPRQSVPPVSPQRRSSQLSPSLPRTASAPGFQAPTKPGVFLAPTQTGPANFQPPKPSVTRSNGVHFGRSFDPKRVSVAAPAAPSTTPGPKTYPGQVSGRQRRPSNISRQERRNSKASVQLPSRGVLSRTSSVQSTLSIQSLSSASFRSSRGNSEAQLRFARGGSADGAGRLELALSKLINMESDAKAILHIDGMHAAVVENLEIVLDKIKQVQDIIENEADRDDRDDIPALLDTESVAWKFTTLTKEVRAYRARASVVTPVDNSAAYELPQYISRFALPPELLRSNAYSCMVSLPPEFSIANCDVVITKADTALSIISLVLRKIQEVDTNYS
eukprot:762525_1